MKKTKFWLLGGVILPTLIISLALIFVGSVSVKFIPLKSNLQSGQINESGLQIPLNQPFTINFAINLSTQDKNRLSTNIAYPEVYELYINQLEIYSPRGNLWFKLPFSSKSQLIEILKIDKQVNFPLSIKLVSKTTNLQLSSNQWLIALLKIVAVFLVIFALNIIIRSLGYVYVQIINPDSRLNIICKRSPNLLIFISLTFICGLYSLAKGQDFNWDFQNYHYYNPFAFLHNRLLIDIEPAGIHSYFSPILDIFNYIVICYCPMWFSAFILGAIGGLFVFGVYKILELLYQNDVHLSRLKNNQPVVYKNSILLSLLLASTGFANLTQLGTTMNESFIAIPIIWSYYLFLRNLLRPCLTYIALSSLLMGIALGLKLTAITLVTSYVLSFLVFFPQKILSRHFMLLLLMLFAGFIMIDGIWMWQMWQTFHNPFFPNMGKFFDPLMNPYYSQLDTRFLPKDLLHWLFMPLYLLFPSQLTGEQYVIEPRYAFAFGLLIISLCKNRGFLQNRLYKFVLFNFIFGYIFWLSLFSIQRYTVALEGLAGIIIIVQLNYLLATKKYIHRYLLTLSLLIFTVTRVADIGHLPNKKKFSDLGIPTQILPHHAIVIFGNKPLAYLAGVLGEDNVYMDRPDQSVMQFNAIRKQILLKQAIVKGIPIYLIDKNPEELTTNGQEWLNQYNFKIGQCKTFQNYSRQIYCRLIQRKQSKNKR